MNSLPSLTLSEDTQEVEKMVPPGFRGQVYFYYPLGKLTTFRIGGPAEVLAEPKDREDLVKIVRWCEEHHFPLTVLGGGTNLLVADTGVRGVVLRLNHFRRLRIRGNKVYAEAGVKLGSLLRACAKAGLSGLEGLVGIPGTVGGALVMNAGTRYGEIGQYLQEAEVVEPSGHILTVPAKDLGLAYRRSNLRETRRILLSALFQLHPEDPERIQQKMKELDEYRRRTQPLTMPNAGCIWKNPPGESAGRLIELAGCKGWREGDAQVSTLHANFIVNLGAARAQDVLRLMNRVRQAVKEKFGILLEPEVQWLGEHQEWESKEYSF